MSGSGHTVPRRWRRTLLRTVGIRFDLPTATAVARAWFEQQIVLIQAVQVGEDGKRLAEARDLRGRPMLLALTGLPVWQQFDAGFSRRADEGGRRQVAGPRREGVRMPGKPSLSVPPRGPDEAGLVMSADLASFEIECADWLAANATPKPARGAFHWGDGDDGVVEI